MIDRRLITHHADGTTTTVMQSLTWGDIRSVRKSELERTDLYYLKDRWDQLSTTRKGELNTYRQTLRDLPENFESADDAADNWPEVPE